MMVTPSPFTPRVRPPKRTLTAKRLSPPLMVVLVLVLQACLLLCIKNKYIHPREEALMRPRRRVARLMLQQAAA